MSATAARQSTFQACAPAEEAYCAPWDLKRQEEKFQYLNGHRPKSPSTIRTVPNRAIIHPFSSEHTPCDQNPSFVSCQLSPPVLPPLPPGGLVPASSGILHHSSRSSLTDHRTVPSQPSDYPRHCIPSNQSSLRNYPAPAIPLGDNLLLTDDSQPMSFQVRLCHVGIVQRCSVLCSGRSSLLSTFNCHESIRYAAHGRRRISISLRATVGYEKSVLYQ